VYFVVKNDKLSFICICFLCRANESRLKKTLTTERNCFNIGAVQITSVTLLFNIFIAMISVQLDHSSPSSSVRTSPSSGVSGRAKGL
jgi:hypothetical protein